VCVCVWVGGRLTVISNSIASHNEKLYSDGYQILKNITTRGGNGKNYFYSFHKKEGGGDGYGTQEFSTTL